MLHLMLEHHVPHDASSYFTPCVAHVVLPKAANQSNNKLARLQKHFGDFDYKRNTSK